MDPWRCGLRPDRTFSCYIWKQRGDVIRTRTRAGPHTAHLYICPIITKLLLPSSRRNMNHVDVVLPLYVTQRAPADTLHRATSVDHLRTRSEPVTLPHLYHLSFTWRREKCLTVRTWLHSFIRFTDWTYWRGQKDECVSTHRRTRMCSSYLSWLALRLWTHTGETEGCDIITSSFTLYIYHHYMCFILTLINWSFNKSCKSSRTVNNDDDRAE